MATTRLMPLHVGKGRDVSTAIADIIDYVENRRKPIMGNSFMAMSAIHEQPMRSFFYPNGSMRT